MPSERMQRRIERLLDEAEVPADQHDWTLVDERVRMVLRLDAANFDAKALAAMVEEADSLTRVSEPPSHSAGDGAASTATAEPLPASFVSGRYTVQAFLGEGGRGPDFAPRSAKG